jgi:hypothetical protein
VQLENKVKDDLEFYNSTDSMNPLRHVSEQIEEEIMRL